MKADILIIGAGSLATIFCSALAIDRNAQKLSIAILSRSKQKAENLAEISNIRASHVENNVNFVGNEIHWDSELDLNEKLDFYSPRVVLMTSSLQSPWDLSNQSKWAQLVKEVGFGITLPLQACLAIKVAESIKERNQSITFINACYPDAVNPLLKSMQLDVACGIGNIAILAAAITRNYDFKRRDIKILAHHYHVGNKVLYSDHQKQLKVWLNDEKLDYLSIANDLSTIWKIKDSSLNFVTGFVSVKLVLAFFHDNATIIHVPGPNGYPGGYPVVINKGLLTLCLPSQVSPSEAISYNRKFSLLDGINVADDGNVSFNNSVNNLLKNHGIKDYSSIDLENFNLILSDIQALKDQI